MKVFYLNTVLKEMDSSCVNKANEEPAENVENGNICCKKVIITDTGEAPEALKEAEIVVDGEIGLKSIEFCKVESQQECLSGTLCIPRLSDISGSRFKIQFFVNKTNIVIVDDTTFSEKMIKLIQARRTKQGQTRERFLYNYLTGIISRDLEVLSRYERTIMLIEEEVNTDHYDTYTKEIPKIRKNLLVLREYYDELRDLGKELEEDENRFFAKKNLKYFGTVSDRADRLMNRTLQLLDYINQVRDTYLQKVSDQQNKNMQFLTVISTIFFPLTLITGWFGMNFKNMPELENGYPYVILLSLAIVGFIIWLFKKRKII